MGDVFSCEYAAEYTGLWARQRYGIDPMDYVEQLTAYPLTDTPILDYYFNPLFYFLHFPRIQGYQEEEQTKSMLGKTNLKPMHRDQYSLGQCCKSH